MKLSMIAAAAASLMLFATAAHAETRITQWNQAPTSVIRLDRLDLSRAEGRDILLFRIERAVRVACSIHPTSAARHACQTEKFETVLAQSPAVRGAVELARMERGEVQVFAAR